MVGRNIFIGDLNDGNFVVSKGDAKALLPEELEAQHYRWTSGERDFDTALKERISIPRANGMLVVCNPDGTIKFDDRKLRYSGHKVSDGIYDIRVGPTHFGEHQSADLRAIADPRYDSFLRERGLKDFNDENAYFSLPFAISGIPVTADNSIHLFRRSDQVEVYPSYWHVIGGSVDPGDDIDIFTQENPTQKMIDMIQKSVQNEFSEEVGIEIARFNLVGLVENANFSYVIHLNCSSAEFLEGFDSAQDRDDHSDVRSLNGKTELEAFLSKDKTIVPAARSALTLYLNQQG